MSALLIARRTSASRRYWRRMSTLTVAIQPPSPSRSADSTASTVWVSVSGSKPSRSSSTGFPTGNTVAAASSGAGDEAEREPRAQWPPVRREQVERLLHRFHAPVEAQRPPLEAHRGRAHEAGDRLGERPHVARGLEPQLGGQPALRRAVDELHALGVELDGDLA